MSDERAVMAICCTGKGGHPWTLLGDITGWGSGMLRANFGATYGEVDERRKGERVWLDHLDKSKPVYRVNMRCYRCTPKRHVQWKHETAVDYLTKLQAAGITQLDISLISSDVSIAK
jgi:hypothetical protein